jgi:hypothetical protein
MRANTRSQFQYALSGPGLVLAVSRHARLLHPRGTLCCASVFLISSELGMFQFPELCQVRRERRAHPVTVSS